MIEQSFADFSSAAADVGFLTFNTRAIFRNYKLVTDASELEAIESAPQPKTSVLFFGDSFVDMYHWETFYEDIADEDAVNVGIGGTKVQLWIDNFDDYILRYQPEKVVMHIGVNDIDGGTSGADTFAMLQELFGLFKEKLPDTEIYFISVSPSVNYWNRHEEVDAVNALVSQLSESEENLHFIDLASELYCEDGSYVREELFDRIERSVRPLHVICGCLRNRQRGRRHSGRDVYDYHRRGNELYLEGRKGRFPRPEK